MISLLLREDEDSKNDVRDRRIIDALGFTLCCFVRKFCGNDILESVRHRPLGMNRNLREMYVSEPKDEEIAYSSMRASIKVLLVCLFFNFKPDKMTCLQNGYRRG